MPATALPAYGEVPGWDGALAVSFLERPRERWRRRRRACLTDETLTYQRANGEIISVPTGFESDGASVPWWCWWLVGHPFDAFLLAALIHDFLCFEPNRAMRHPGTVHRIMYEVMRWQVAHDLLPRWKAEVVYLAVRVAGPRWRRRA